MTLTKFLADAYEMLYSHYKFGKPPLEARVVVLEEMVKELCIVIDTMKQGNHDE
jgi:hypothetical protein